jgi:DNA-binding IclR family transcriptional regulator
MAESDKEKPSVGVEAVDRALAILSCFSDRERRQTLTELATATGFYKSTLLRVAASLERAGYLRREADKAYVLGPELFRLGAVYQRSTRLEAPVRAALRDLLAAVGESASFFQRAGDHRLCLFREDSDHSIREHVREGDLLPIDRGSSGHVLVRFSQNETLRTGAFRALPIASFGERDPDTASASAPVFGPSGALLGALAVSGPRARLTRTRLEAAGPIVVATARQLSITLGGGNVWSEAVG